MAPFSVTIGGTVCDGTSVIASGTQVTGLTVPAGAGTGLTIVVHSGTLPPQTLAMTFDYAAPSDVKPDSSKTDSGCNSATGNTGWLILFALLSLSGVAIARRVRA
jgi:uncharacterized protein (TIGR03382 family)